MDENSLAKELSKTYLNSVSLEDNRKIILFGCDERFLENLKSCMVQYINTGRKNVGIFIEKELTKGEILEKSDQYLIDVGYFFKKTF